MFCVLLRSLRTLALLTSAMLIGAAVHAADQPIFGTKLLIKNPSSGASGNKLVHLGKDSSIAIGPAGGNGDPTCSGAAGGGTSSLRIVASGSAGDVNIPLPCAAWTTNGKHTLYAYKDASGATCARVLVKNGVLVKAVCKGMQVAIDLSGDMSPVAVVTTLNDDVFCSEFGGTVVKDGSDGKTFHRKDAAAPVACPPPPTSNRDRLLATYLGYLDSDPTKTQSNGLRGADLNTVCDLWAALDPSSRASFLTITARLDGSRLVDDSTMLDHVTALYRVTGGQGATSIDPGSCGGGDFNRLMMSIDPQLHAALVAANTNHGGGMMDGRPDIADILVGGFWRDSHDVGGTHAPFDLSDETNDGAPRGQAQYFVDPASTLANSALGRLDLESLIDPYALEIDQDYDCTHDSNPLCNYTSYGPLCFPEPSLLGTALYSDTYGDFGAAWQPAGCP